MVYVYLHNLADAPIQSGTCQSYEMKLFDW